MFLPITEKTTLEFLRKHQNLDPVNRQLNKKKAMKQDFKGQSLYFNHRISFDNIGPISPTSEGNSYVMVIVDAFIH